MALFIIIQKFYMGKTVDNQYKIVNFTFQRLETLDQDAYLIGLRSDGKIVYMMSEKFKGKPEDDYTDRMKKELKEPMRELADKALESIGIKMPEGPRSGDSFGDVIDTMFSTQKSLKPESRIKSIHAWETETGEFLYSCNFPELDISKKFLTFDFDNETLFFLNPDNKLEIRNFRYNKVLKEIDPHCWPCSYLTISRDFKVIAYENGEGDFEIYDVETGNLIDKIELRGERVKEVDTNLDEKYGKSLADPFGSMVCKLSDDGNLLAFDGADGQFCIYNIPEKRIVNIINSCRDSRIDQVISIALFFINITEPVGEKFQTVILDLSFRFMNFCPIHIHYFVQQSRERKFEFFIQDNFTYTLSIPT